MEIAVMGYGTIGSGVVEIVKNNAAVIERTAGFPINVKKVLDVRDFSGDPLVGGKVTADYMEIVNDPDIRIVVETMGGVEPAYTFVKAMLEAGKHVTTSNKALVADKGAELMQIAKAHKVTFLFEAAVGGGIPVIRPMAVNMASDEIELIEGIVNGTTNYILTRMKNSGCSYEAALKEAQEMGYAEKDPGADVDGFDAARKIAILTSIACGKIVDFNDVTTTGIRGVSLEDFEYAKALNRELKLIARAHKSGDTYELMVAPCLIEKTHPLSFVSDVFNGIFIRGNMLGDSMYYGSGAGKLPTASAVMGDVIDLARNAEKNMYTLWTEEKLVVGEPKDSVCRFLVRTKDADKCQKALGGEIIDAGVASEQSVLTGEMTEGDFNNKLNGLDVISFTRVL